jgi:DNA-directed RNA polymerase specialized sigma24 family protein
MKRGLGALWRLPWPRKVIFDRATGGCCGRRQAWRPRCYPKISERSTAVEDLTPLQRWLLICEVLGKLKPEHALTIWLAFFVGLTVREMARGQNISLAAARKRLQRAIEAARTLVGTSRKKRTL